MKIFGMIFFLVVLSLTSASPAFSANTCSDSDTKNDVFTPGEAIILDANQKQILKSSDVCSGKQLVQVSCSAQNTIVKSAPSNCPTLSACLSGVCKYHCNDTDKNNDPAVAGVVTGFDTGTKKLSPDVCVGDKLTQFACSTVGKVVRTGYDCAGFKSGGYCSAGICKPLCSTDVNFDGQIDKQDQPCGVFPQLLPFDNGTSSEPGLNSDGRFVVLQHYSNNNVPADLYGSNVLLHDRKTGITKNVHVSSNGIKGNKAAGKPDISADGLVIAYESTSTNLVVGDSNKVSDIFVRDMHDNSTVKTERVSIESNGAQSKVPSYAPALDADGSVIAFESVGDPNSAPLDSYGSASYGKKNIYVHDQESGDTVRVSVASNGTYGNADSQSPHVNAEGRFVAFASKANNLVAGDTNKAMDVFVHDRETEETERVSVFGGGSVFDDNGVQGKGDSSEPKISADGRFVAFSAFADAPAVSDPYGQHVFIHDRDEGKTELVSKSSGGQVGNDNSFAPALSADGRYVVFSSLATNLVAGDKNENADIFVHDRDTGKTELVSVTGGGITSSNGNFYNPAFSADGHFITFEFKKKFGNFFTDIYIAINPLWEKP